MSFVLPNAQQINEALGDITELPEDMQIAVTSKLDESFPPVPKPKGSDWLNSHKETGQTMESFGRRVHKAVPHGTHKTIYIQPVGKFDHPRAAPLDLIIEFARAFFSGCDIELLPTIDFTEDMKHRINPYTQQIQYRTDGFYNYFSRTRSQRDSRRELLCVAVTMADLYPDEAWNFVYGQARTTDGFGVYSFARLDPLFPESPEELRNVLLTEEHRVIMLRRCVKILLHEVGHLFGLKHCIYYLCLMNGANHEREMDQQTLYLCPVCLHKLYSTLKFDVRQMYEAFVSLCGKHGLEKERAWYQKRLDCF